MRPIGRSRGEARSRGSAVGSAGSGGASPVSGVRWERRRGERLLQRRQVQRGVGEQAEDEVLAALELEADGGVVDELAVVEVLDQADELEHL